MSHHYSKTVSEPTRWIGIGATVIVHALLVSGLIFYAPAGEVLRSVAPLMVELIKPDLPSPPAAVRHPKVDRLPKPLPVRSAQSRPEPETRLLVASATAPGAQVVAVPAEPKTLPPIEAPPASPAPPGPLVPPSFNASYLDNPAPAYPPMSRRTGEEGRVMLRVLVEASGLPSRVEIRASSGSERLDQAAVEAVRRWKFVPARQGDQAVPAFVIVPVSFSLKG